MSGEVRDSLKRLDRLIQIKRTYVSLAEANLKAAESEVLQLQTAESEIALNIQELRAGIAYMSTAVAGDLQNGEKCIEALQLHRKQVRERLEEATRSLEQRRTEWTEAMREEKVIGNAQKRRSDRFDREEEVSCEKAQDDLTLTRHVRNREV